MGLLNGLVNGISLQYGKKQSFKILQEIQKHKEKILRQILTINQMINKLKYKQLLLFVILIFIMIEPVCSQSSTCTRQRCCLVNPCDAKHCTDRSTDTWSGPIASFVYTKLVLANNSCKPCPYDCQACASESSCTTCAKGFYMDSSRGRCMLCSDRCLTCTVINMITKCSSCDSGTYLDANTQSCKSCPTGAKTCSSPTAIIDCQTGYRKSSNSLYCTPCPSNCISCPISDTICNTCGTGYYLNGSLCYQCNLSNCVTCSYSGSSINCASCSPGYFLRLGACIGCPSNCRTCTSATACTVCNTGFYLSNGACVAVDSQITNCQTYSSSSTCSVCSSSFYLSSNVCYPCSLLCATCQGPHFGRCLTCNSNAVLFNRMCLINNFPSTSTYNLYFSFPASINLISAGSLSCGQYVSGSSITLMLNNLKAYKLEISWKVYSLSSSSSYSVTLSNTDGNNSFTYSTSQLGAQYNNMCDNDTSTQYFMDIKRSQMFTSIKKQNTLTFSTTTGSSLALHEVIITVYKCNDLCVQCSENLCTQCLMPKLYTQDAYCVSACSNNYYLYINSSNINNPNRCVSSCPLGTYTMTANASCLPCTSPCQTCLSQVFCLSCVDDHYLTADNSCTTTCPYKYYGKIQTKTCQKCVGRCLQCINEEKCLSCNVGFLLNTTMSCVDSCQESVIGVVGLYASLQTLYCQSCDSNCLNCLYQSTLCTQCITTMYFWDSKCLQSCSDGTYSPSGSNVCHHCSFPCKTCEAVSTNCISCLDGYLYNNTCVTSCPSGYFEDNINLLCVSCDSMCQQCYGSSSYCLSCKSGFYYFRYACYSDCPEGNYKNDTIFQCVSCVGLCKDCLNQTYCLSCKSNFLYNGNCVSSGQCPTGYFADMITLSCQPCSSPCKQCQYTSTYCTQCDINNQLGLIFLQNNTCLSACSTKFYYPKVNETSASCEPCQQPCLQCISQSLCLSCIQGYKYSNNMCSSTCSVGTYFDSLINDCTNCTSNCEICSSSLFCQKCQSSFYLNFISSTQNQCVSSCPTAYYEDTLSFSCQKCIYPCNECSSSIDCITCLSGAVYQSRCISSCPDSTYLQVSTNKCISCDSNCLTCSSIPTRCQSCKDGFYLYNANHTCLVVCPVGLYAQIMTKSCLSCPSTCYSCVNTTYCTQCIQNVTFMTSINTCVIACPSGYYGNIPTSTCEKCAAKCLTCQSSSTNCLSCVTGYYFIKLSYTTSDCQLTCPPGYYPESSYCYQCSFPCKTCQTSSKCLTCIEGTYFHADSSSCLLNCPMGTFYNHTNSTCQSCQYPCSSCDNNASYCLSCSQTTNSTVLYLYNGQCVQNCPSKYYSDDSGICNKCYGLCLTCSSKYYCNSCLAGYVYDGFCYSSCPLGTYANTKTNSCENCALPCSQCIINENYCTKCTSGLFVYKGNCSSTCPTGTYQQNGQCKTCSFPCINCQSQNTCGQCLGGYLLYMNLTCINDTAFCPNDFYKMDAKYCVPITWCPSTYFIDESLKTCSRECDHKEYTNLETKKCESSCSQGWYAGVDLVCQQWTTNPPSSLMGMQTITYIQSSYLFIEVRFNETVVWRDVQIGMYTLSLVDVARLLMVDQYSVPEYTMSLETPTLLRLKPSTYPQRINIHLPAYRVRSAITSYPHQNPSITVNLPSFTPYSNSQIYSGMIMGQFSQGISWFILLLSLFFLFKNRLSDLYVLWDVVQLLYLLIFLDIQYPPNINQFFRGLKFTHFTFLPSIFSSSSQRKQSSSPFYAYSYDSSFTRNTGGLFMGLIIVFGILILLKISQAFIRHVQSVKQKIRQYPQVKGFIYRGVLRYRWHHISDVMFLTYNLMLLFAFSEIYYISQNPGYVFSNILSVLTAIFYILWVLFVAYKLYKHYGNISRGKMVNNLKCFYRGIQKDNKFGVSLVLVRYARKLFYALVISLFSTNAMFALPILMFTSVLMALFLFVNLPYKKKLSNYITLASQIVLVIMYMLLALINFNGETFSPITKHSIGWICCILLALMIFALVYEVFCKTMFYLEPQVSPAEIINDQKKQKLLSEKQKQYLRKKAQEFFDSLLPRLRERLNLDEDSDDELYKHYEEGDSQNSENNEQRERDWNEDGESHNSDQFKHYDNSQHSQIATSMNSKPKLKQAPQYLVRCVKDIE